MKQFTKTSLKICNGKRSEKVIFHEKHMTKYNLMRLKTLYRASL